MSAVCEIELTRGFVALADEEDFALVSQFKWYASPNGRRTYAVNKTGRRPSVHMHRLVIRAVKGQKVDHRNGNGLDNRRANLRFCSQTQNLGNSRLSSRNRSGFKGVSFDKRRNLWTADIQVNGKDIFLGYFRSPKHAALAYNGAARRLFGEFARPNSFPIVRTTGI